MTSWHNTDIHTNTVRTNFNHFSTLLQNLVLLWLILFEKYFFKHSNPVSSVVSEIKSGVRGSYAAEKVGTLKVKASTVSAADPGFKSHLRQDISGSSHTSDLNIGTPVATQPGTWHYGVSAGSGWSGVSVLWLDEMVWSATFISVWQHIKLSEQIHPRGTLACCWDVQ